MPRIAGPIQKVGTWKSKSGKDIYSYTINGKQFSGFGKPQFAQGDNITLDYAISGQYNNISKVYSEPEPAGPEDFMTADKIDESNLFMKEIMRLAAEIVRLRNDWATGKPFRAKA